MCIVEHKCTLFSWPTNLFSAFIDQYLYLLLFFDFFCCNDKDFDADFSDIPPLSDHDNNTSTSCNDILKPDSLSRNATILPQTSNEMEVESLSSSSATSSINTRSKLNTWNSVNAWFSFFDLFYFSDLPIKDKLVVTLHSCKEVPTSKLVNDFKGVYSKKHINQVI